jgi:hypothetical protein
VSPAEDQVAIVDEDCFLTVHDLTSPRVRYELPLGEGIPTSCRFMGSTKRLVIATGDGRLLLVDTLNGAVIGEWREHTKGVLSLAASRCGREVVSTSLDQSARLWTFNDDTLIESRVVHEEAFPIPCATFVLNGAGIAMGTADGRLCIVVRDPHWHMFHQGWLHDGGICHCGSSDNGQLLWTVGLDQRLIITGLRLDLPVTPLKSAELGADSSTFAVDEGHRSCIMSFGDRVVELPFEGRAITLKKCQATCCVAEPLHSGHAAITIDQDGSIAMVRRGTPDEASAGRRIDSIRWLQDRGRICAMTDPVPRHGMHVVGRDPDFHVAIWDPDSPRPQLEADFPGHWITQTALSVPAEALLFPTTMDEQYPPDGSTGIQGIHVIDLRQMQPAGLLPCTGEVKAIATDDRYPLAAATDEGNLMMWDLESRRLRWKTDLQASDTEDAKIVIDLERSVLLLRGPYRVTAFRPEDGCRIPLDPAHGLDEWQLGPPSTLAARGGTEVVLCGIERDRLVYRSNGGRLRWFCAEGVERFLALAEDGVVRYFSADGTAISALGDHSSAVLPIRKGKYVISISCKDVIRLWNPIEDRVLAACRIREPVTSAAVHPFGTTIAIGTSSGVILTYGIEDGQLHAEQ